MINPKKQEYYVKLYKMIAYRLFAAKQQLSVEQTNLRAEEIMKKITLKEAILQRITVKNKQLNFPLNILEKYRDINEKQFSRRINRHIGRCHLTLDSNLLDFIVHTIEALIYCSSFNKDLGMAMRLKDLDYINNFSSKISDSEDFVPTTVCQ